MFSSLHSRLDKLEAKAGTKNSAPKVVRLVCSEEEYRENMNELHRRAKELGLDTGPGSNDILIIRLVGLTPHDRENSAA